MNSPLAPVNPGSFRDRDGRVYHYKGRVFRGLSESALDTFRSLQEKSFYQKLVKTGKVIGTHEISDKENPLPDEVRSGWGGIS